MKVYFLILHKYIHNVLDFACWLAKLKMFTVLPLTKRVCQLSSKMQIKDLPSLEEYNISRTYKIFHIQCLTFKDKLLGTPSNKTIWLETKRKQMIETECMCFGYCSYQERMFFKKKKRWRISPNQGHIWENTTNVTKSRDKKIIIFFKLMYDTSPNASPHPQLLGLLTLLLLLYIIQFIIFFYIGDNGYIL